MKNQIRLAAVGVLFATSCNQEPTDRIVGAYAQERKVEKTDDTHRVIGTVTTRDTLFVSKKENGYQIDNRVWKFRDYDKDGWVRISNHEGARYTHICTYDKTDHSLNPVMSGLFLPMYLDLENGLLSYEKEFAYPWVKVK